MVEAKVSTTVAQRSDNSKRVGGRAGAVMGSGLGLVAPILAGAGLGGEAGDLVGMETAGRVAGGVAGSTLAPLTTGYGALYGRSVGRNAGEEASALRTAVTPRSQLAREHVRGSNLEEAQHFQNVAHSVGTDPKILAGIDEEVTKKAALEDRSEAQVYSDAGLGPKTSPDFAAHGRRLGRGLGAAVGGTMSRLVAVPVLGATGTVANQFIPEHRTTASEVLALPKTKVDDYVDQVDQDPNTTEAVRDSANQALKLRRATEQPNPQAQPEGSLASPLHSA